ncbi:MAG: glyoxalase, partial [Proteobacteria bacterium]|nr:glyoxalase [Pseudomonadota bacterium]
MSVLGIDQITYGADDLATCRRFFSDWGLTLASERADELVFETLNGCRVVVAAQA